MGEEDKVEINRLKEVLFEMRISQSDLADRVKKSKQSINRICSNSSQPTLKFLREIAVALEVNIQELLIPTPGKSNEKK